MRLATTALFASSAAAISFPSLPDVSSIFPLFARAQSSGSGGGGGTCPPVWNSISADLTKDFLSGGQCTPLARAAIRLIFHDCGAWQTSLGATGGCDGSLILAGELDRDENTGLREVANYVQALATRRKVGVADAIVFSGLHAIVTCPGGPRVKAYIGRNDSSTAAPPNLLPNVNAPADELYKLFQDKGFSAVDLAAILGAHSTSNQFNVDKSQENAGKGQDSTPGVWDVKYYAETLQSPPRQDVFVFNSDKALANHATVGKEFAGFVNNQGKWNGKFADAMGRMALFGSAGTAGLVDCTNALPAATNIKRELRAMPLFAPRN